MSQPLLSILIPTVVGREEQFDNLLYRINSLCEKATGLTGRFTNSKGCNEGVAVYVGKPGEHIVEICFSRDNKEKTIGQKREELYQMASGLYSFMPDDDDDISDNAIELILEAIKSNPDVDCVTFEERCQMNGQLYCANHSLRYGGWEGDGSRLLSDGYHFHRTPFYKNVIKTSIAQSVPFEKIRFGEDHAWSIAIYPHLKTEIHIPKQLYYYIYEPKESHNERYGITE